MTSSSAATPASGQGEPCQHCSCPDQTFPGQTPANCTPSKTRVGVRIAL